MALLKFLKGNYSSLSTKAIAEGQVLICGDTGEMFVDVAADKRVKIGDFVVVSDIQSLETLDATVVPTSRLYYVEDGNILARSNGAGWTQINKQKTLAELGGVSSTTYTEDKAALVQADADNATAISNLKTYVGTIPDTADATNIVAYVQEKTAGIATDAALEELTGRVDAAETDIDNLQAAIGEGGSVTNAIAAAKKAGDDAQAAADTAQADVNALKAKVGTIADGSTVAGLIATAQAQADKGVADAATAQGDVDALEAKVGAVEDGKTVVEMIAEAKAEATYDDSALTARVAANEGAIATLNGTGEGSVSKQVADAVAQIVADAPEAYDTLKEISDWISNHANDASAMNSQINTNKTDIANLTALVGSLPEGAASTTVVAYIQEAIDALKIGDYAKAADLTAAITRIDTAEGKITALESASHTHDNKALLDTYTQTEEDLADAVAKKHSHANATVLDGITAEKVSAWDSAETNAKNYTDELADGQVATNKANIEALQTGKADKATTLAGYGIIDAYTKAEVEDMLTWGSF